MKSTYDQRAVPEIEGARIAILQSKWYSEHTDRMVDRCRALLLGAKAAAVERHVVPGSLELPIASQVLLSQGAYDALICFGAVLKGETAHFDIVVDGCARGLQEVSLRFTVPIIVEVLPCTDISQLIARSADDESNKGIEAALAAAEFISWRRQLRSSAASGALGFAK